MLNRADIDRSTARDDVLDVGNRRVLLALEYGIDFLERLSLGFDPVVPLRPVSIQSTSYEATARTYNEEDNDDVPGSVHHIHPPADAAEADGHDEGKECSTTAVSKITEQRRGLPQNIRQGVEHELGEGQSIRPDRVVHNLGGIQVQQRRPGYRVEALEEEHDGHVAVDEALRSPCLVVGVHFGEPADDEETYRNENLGQECRRLATPLINQPSADQGAGKTPNVQDDILQGVSRLANPATALEHSRP